MMNIKIIVLLSLAAYVSCGITTSSENDANCTKRNLDQPENSNSASYEEKTEPELKKLRLQFSEAELKMDVEEFKDAASCNKTDLAENSSSASAKEKTGPEQKPEAELKIEGEEFKGVASSSKTDLPETSTGPKQKTQAELEEEAKLEKEAKLKEEAEIIKDSFMSCIKLIIVGNKYIVDAITEHDFCKCMGTGHSEGNRAHKFKQKYLLDHPQEGNDYYNVDLKLYGDLLKNHCEKIELPLKECAKQLNDIMIQRAKKEAEEWEQLVQRVHKRQMKAD